MAENGRRPTTDGDRSLEALRAAQSHTSRRLEAMREEFRRLSTEVQNELQLIKVRKAAATTPIARAASMAFRGGRRNREQEDRRQRRYPRVQSSDSEEDERYLPGRRIKIDKATATTPIARGEPMVFRGGRRYREQEDRRQRARKQENPIDLRGGRRNQIQATLRRNREPVVLVGFDGDESEEEEEALHDRPKALYDRPPRRVSAYSSDSEEIERRNDFRPNWELRQNDFPPNMSPSKPNSSCESKLKENASVMALEESFQMKEEGVDVSDSVQTRTEFFFTNCSLSGVSGISQATTTNLMMVRVPPAA